MPTSVSAELEYPLQGMLREVDTEGELAPCHLQRLILGRNALATLPQIVRDLVPSAADQRPTVVLLVDRTPIERDGEDIKGVVEHQMARFADVRRVVLDDGAEELHVVDSILDEARAAVADADAVLALGGGTISDIGKVAASGTPGHRVPVLISVQTAASVDGFTDDVSVILRDGVKRTVPSRWPDVVVADAATIAAAPARMNRAGFGEMTSMLTAPADWRLASLVGVETGFRWSAVRLLERVGRGLGDWASGVRGAEPNALEKLTEALALRGVVTGVAGTTAVLSGVEHLISHMLDQHHSQNGLPMGLHGAQVGAAGVVAAATWEMLFDRLGEAGSAPPPIVESTLQPEQARDRVERAFLPLDPSGGVAAECWRDYASKLASLVEQRSRLAEVLTQWHIHGEELRRLVRPSAELAGLLVAAGAPATFDELQPAVPAGLARWALGNCALMRNRFTVVDLLVALGWWQEADVAEVEDRARHAVASVRGLV